jgi:hypothetical protein
MSGCFTWLWRKWKTYDYIVWHDSNFAIINLPFLCGGGGSFSSAYGVCASQLIRYTKAYSAYWKISEQGQLLTKGLMVQGWGGSRLKSSFRRFWDHYYDLVCFCKVSLVRVLNDFFHALCWTVVSILALTTSNPRYLISTKGAQRCGLFAEDTYSSVAPEHAFTFVRGSVLLCTRFVFAFWIMITFGALLTSLFYIVYALFTNSS